MKVTLESYGGLAAAARRRPKVLDTAALPENAAAEMTQLVAAAVAMPVEDQADRARDAMTYTITVEDDDHVTVLEQSDASMSPAFATLLAWLKKDLR
ncbi:protealysin inhibitor emfourin [Streptomyces katrae]|uniref:protealysin inhibitor emfourin n=1 Tax=Streptomyces katrae TaxID=68223 RepID=UPI0004BEC93B|nr:protealysin inhibitor emfourin [Streptomyces katrae]